MTFWSKFWSLKWAKSTAAYNYWFAGLYACSLLWGLATLSGWQWLQAYLLGVFAITFGVSYGIHRIVIHKASNPPQFIRRASLLVSVLTNTSSPVLWVGSHYVHHRHSDDKGRDPHDPQLGKRVLFGYYHMPALEAEAKQVRTALKHVVADKFCRWLHSYYFAILAWWYVACFMLFGGVAGLLTYGLVPSALGFYGLMLLNYFGHGRVPGAYRNHGAALSNNVWWLWPLLLGENWHNNHHASPNAKTTWERWWEVDLVAFFVYLFDDENWIKLKFRVKKFLARFKRHDERQEPYTY